MIGGKIKLIRKSYNITLKELSNRTGLSVSFLSNIERNTASPTEGIMTNFEKKYRQEGRPIYRSIIEFDKAE